MAIILQCEVIAESYLVVDEAGMLGLLSVIYQEGLRTAVYLSRMFVHQIERVSRELGASSAFALYQEGIVWT